MPPGSMSGSACSPRRTCSEARRLEPASVRTRVPSEKSSARSAWRPESLACGGRQCKRPAIMRWITSQSSPGSPTTGLCRWGGRSSSTPMAMRLPMRRSSRTVRPSTAVMGGSAVRRTKTLCRRNALQRLTEDARLERGEICGDVGQFRHCFKIEAKMRGVRNGFFPLLVQESHYR